MNAIDKARKAIVQPAQLRLEEAAIAILIERIASLDQEVKDDLMAVLMEVKPTATAEDMAEVEQTIRELIYPDLIGDLVVGKAGNANAGERLTAWSERIGGRIKQLRTERGWSQEELAERSGLPQPHISRLETGRHSPSHKTILALASALGVSAKEIDPSAEDSR